MSDDYIIDYRPDSDDFPKLLDRLGIHVKVQDIPEIVEYQNYCYNAPRLIRWWRRVFKPVEISRLRFEAQMAMLNATLEVYDELTE